MATDRFDDASTSVWGDQPSSNSYPSAPVQVQSTFPAVPSTLSEQEDDLREVEHHAPATIGNEQSIEQSDQKICVETQPLPATVNAATSSLVPTSLEDSLGQEKALAFRKEAKSMQDGLAAILERILEVKSEYERLEDENKFLQDYIGNLMSRSKMLTTKTAD
ncbi:hypothetical protein V1525DRAFT_127069 [Lipomyces kononenkoae]|uniref:Uncharacterized protein n=1 Tax=Lipomyces kononenkoae TaxID=34357 RepID=A0ACC3T2S1_LIPKO